SRRGRFGRVRDASFGSCTRAPPPAPPRTTVRRCTVGVARPALSAYDLSLVARRSFGRMRDAFGADGSRSSTLRSGAASLARLRRSGGWGLSAPATGRYLRDRARPQLAAPDLLHGALGYRSAYVQAGLDVVPARRDVAL